MMKLRRTFQSDTHRFIFDDDGVIIYYKTKDAFDNEYWGLQLEYSRYKVCPDAKLLKSLMEAKEI